MEDRINRINRINGRGSGGVKRVGNQGVADGGETDPLSKLRQQLGARGLGRLHLAADFCGGRVLVPSGEWATIHRRGAEAQRGKPQNAKMLGAMQGHHRGGGPGGLAALWWQSHPASMTQIGAGVVVSG